MDLLRKLIIERVYMRDGTGEGLLDIYYYLLGHGAKPEDSIQATIFFIDEIIAMKVLRDKWGEPIKTAALE